MAQSAPTRKRLARVGKSLALIVDRTMLADLGIDAETELEVRVVGGRLVVERVTAATAANAGEGAA